MTDKLTRGSFWIWKRFGCRDYPVRSLGERWIGSKVQVVDEWGVRWFIPEAQLHEPGPDDSFEPYIGQADDYGTFADCMNVIGEPRVQIPHKAPDELPSVFRFVGLIS